MLLDELERLKIAPLLRQRHIALHGNVRGTCRLARRGAALDDVGAVGAEVGVVVLAAPEQGVARGLCRARDRRAAGAELAAELHGVHLAVFHALAAGDALVAVHAGDVVRLHGVGRAEIGRDAQRVAAAAAAVADRGGVLVAGGHVQLVHEAVALGALENLIGLLLRDHAVRADFGVVHGVVVEVDAHVLLEVSAALAHQAAGAAAGAGAHGHGPGVLHEAVHLIVAGLAGVVLDRGLHGDDAHHVHAGVHKRGEHAHAAAGVFLKALAEHGILVALLAVGHDALHDAGHPDGIEIIGLAVAHALAHGAGFAQLVELLLRVVDGLLRALGDVLHGAVGLQTHVHHDLAHIVVDDRLQDLVLGVVVGDAGVGHALKADLRRQLENIRSVCHKYSLPLYTRICRTIHYNLPYSQHHFNTMMNIGDIFLPTLVIPRNLFYYKR